jgi:hypothetical protein
MRHVVLLLSMLGMPGAVQAQEAPTTPEMMMREMVSPDDLRFLFGEARLAVRAAAKGDAYVPAPEASARAKLIGERMRAKGFGVLEILLDQIERELLEELPAEPNKNAVPQTPAERTPI